MRYSSGKKMRGSSLQGGDGENKQWRRAEREKEREENLIQAHLPVDVATIQPERRGLQTLEEENEQNKSRGEMKAEML